MSKKESIELYDNVDHEQMIDMILKFSFGNMWADDIRWLKRYNYIPEDKCVCCGEKVISSFHCVCWKCKNTVKTEIEYFKEYYKKYKE